jgi:hypothetical protein
MRRSPGAAFWCDWLIVGSILFVIGSTVVWALAIVTALR